MRSLVTLFVGFLLSLAIGLGSTWYMIAKGSPLTTGSIGPWVTWYEAGNPQADPYTMAYLARSGRLPITSTSAAYYFARTDGTGAALRSDCEYVLEGKPIAAVWWSLAAYDEAGRLIPNQAKRYSFSRSEVLRQTDGSFEIVLASTARPGNWLPTGEAGKVQLVLRLYGPQNSNTTISGRLVNRPLPTIRRVTCR